MKLLTIGIPTFNSAEYLNEAIGKILAQSATHADVEILVCDNASTDDTPAMMSRLMAAHPDSIRYVRHATNLGMDANFWSAIENAKSEYVHLHADDDFYTEGALERLLEVIQLRDVDVVLLSNNYLNTKNGKIMQVKEALQEDVSCRLNGEKFFLNENLKTLCLSNVVLRRSRCMEIANVAGYFNSHWMHVALVTEIVRPQSSAYIFNFINPLVTVRIGNQRWLEKEGAIIYYLSVLKLFETLRRTYPKRVFEHIKILFLPLIMNGGGINFKSFWRNVFFSLKFFRFYWNMPRQYLKFCGRLILLKHRKFFEGWEKREDG